MPTTYQTTTPYESLADFLARLLDPDGSADAGLYWTASAFSTGTSYPAFLAMVEDDSGRMWPCGATSSVAIDFAVANGSNVGLYLIPFSESELPSYASGQIGDFTLVADSSAPDDALLLGTGDITSSSFTSFSESGSARIAVSASSLLPLTDLTGLASGDLLQYDGSGRFVRVDPEDLAPDLGLASARGRLYPDSSVTIADSTVTAIDWDGESRTLTNLGWNSGQPTRVVVEQAGLYLIVAQTTWAPNATGQRQIQLAVNGTSVANTSEAPTSATYAAVQLTIQYDLDVDDYLELKVYQNSGGNLDISGSYAWTRWTITRLAP